MGCRIWGASPLEYPYTLRLLRLRGSIPGSADCPILQSRFPNLTALSLERLAISECMDAIKAFLRNHWPQLALSVGPNWRRAGVYTGLDVPDSLPFPALQMWHEMDFAPDWPTRVRCVLQDAPIFPDLDMSDLPASSVNQFRDRLPEMALPELALVRSVRADSPDPPPDSCATCFRVCRKSSSCPESRRSHTLRARACGA